MPLSGYATLTTIYSPIIYSIIATIITVSFTEYIRRRITSTRSQKIFLTALKDYDDNFFTNYTAVKHYLLISFIVQLIGGFIAVILLTIKYSYALNSLLAYMTFVTVVIMILRIGAFSILSVLSIENSHQAYITKATGFGIFIDSSATLIVSIFAFLLLLSLQLLHANFIQNNLEILFISLVYWLIFAYIPTAIAWWKSRDIRSNITTSWEFMLINPRISDLKTSFNLILKLNYGHQVYGKLLQVNNFGIILEENVPKNSLMSEPFRTYVPWQEVVSIGIVKEKYVE